MRLTRRRLRRILNEAVETTLQELSQDDADGTIAYAADAGDAERQKNMNGKL